MGHFVMASTIKYRLAPDPVGKMILGRTRLLQSAQGQKIVHQRPIDLKEDTVLLFYCNELFTYSTAALRSLILLGGYLKWMGYAGLVVPKFIRDAVYRFIAKNRYRWFGTKACLLPDSNLKDRFI